MLLRELHVVPLSSVAPVEPTVRGCERNLRAAPEEPGSSLAGSNSRTDHVGSYSLAGSRRAVSRGRVQYPPRRSRGPRYWEAGSKRRMGVRVLAKKAPSISDPRALGRVIRDPVHDYVVLPHELDDLLGHRLVQRMRRIGQTSLSSSVYPSMSGNRYEHALGAMHLSREA